MSLTSNEGNLDTWTLTYVVDENGTHSNEVRLRNPLQPGFYYSMHIQEALALFQFGLGSLHEGKIRSEFGVLRAPGYEYPGNGKLDGGDVNYYVRW